MSLLMMLMSFATKINIFDTTNDYISHKINFSWKCTFHRAYFKLQWKMISRFGCVRCAPIFLSLKNVCFFLFFSMDDDFEHLKLDSLRILASSIFQWLIKLLFNFKHSIDAHSRHMKILFFSFSALFLFQVSVFYFTENWSIWQTESLIKSQEHPKEEMTKIWKYFDWIRECTSFTSNGFDCDTFANKFIHRSTAKLPILFVRNEWFSWNIFCYLLDAEFMLHRKFKPKSPKICESSQSQNENCCEIHW